MNNLNILDVCAEFGIKLTSHNKAKCPLHEEKTASFKVYTDTNSFYCFGCSIGGDAIRLKALLLNTTDADVLKMNGIMNKEQAIATHKYKTKINEEKEKKQWIINKEIELLNDLEKLKQNSQTDKFIYNTFKNHKFKSFDEMPAIYIRALQRKNTYANLIGYINYLLDWLWEYPDDFYLTHK